MLSYARRSLLASFLLLLMLLVLHAETSEPKPTPKQIARWVERLGDNDFKAREEASKKLWQAGAAAEPALEKAAKSDDREVARRARELLDKFRWGIYPDTPPDIVALIHAYRSSAGQQRKEILRKLLDSGDAGLRAIAKIAGAEKDADQRRILVDLVAGKLPGALLHAATEGKYEQIERLLECGHEGKFIGHNYYAAYWLLRSKLPQRIAHFAARLAEQRDDKWTAQALAYLHRANGDLAAARKAAEASERADLLEGILYEMSDWKALAERAANTAEKPAENGIYHVTGAGNLAQKWAYRAGFARLAGRPKEFEIAVAELRKFAGSNANPDSLAYVAAKGLLLNDRPEDGLEVLRTVPDRRDLLFDILRARLDFAAALELAAKEKPNPKEVPQLGFARARLLCLLGEKEGEALFDRYAERIKDGIDPEWVQSLLKEEMRAGLKDRAFAHAAKALSVGPPKLWSEPHDEAVERTWRYYSEPLFPQQTTTAQVWWCLLRLQFKDEPAAAVLKRLRELMEGKLAAKDVKQWLDRVEQMDPRVVLMRVSSWTNVEALALAQAEIALRAGLDDRASSLLEKANNRDALLRLGDLLAAKKQWDKASERYRQAWEKQSQGKSGDAPLDPLPLYLAGDALVHAGQAEAGKKRIEQAHWIPFADSEARFRFITALYQRGHKEAARREYELMLRVSEPNTLPSNNAKRLLAYDSLARKEFQSAADDLEQMMMLCFVPHIYFIEPASYVNMPAQIHRLRAAALLAAGKIDEAIRHAELGLTVAPGYVDLPIALVPELERRGHKKEAADLFNRCYGAYEKVCRDYPRYAQGHNSMAWLSVCCGRNLDTALKHAEKAVELAPTYAGYLDTLAEIHFQRGDKEKAIALQKRAVKLNPKKAYYRKQLKRLEAGDPSAERPTENDE